MAVHPRAVWLTLFLAVAAFCIGLLVAERSGWLAASERFYLSDRLSSLDVRLVDGTPRVVLDEVSGEALTGEAFLGELLSRRDGGQADHLLLRIFDITSWTGMLWVGMGLFAQVLFTGRMVVQWISSERARASVVPEAFWWLSLLGATMLLMYFTWRRDIVGIIGQATGWSVYVRNLWLIHRNDHGPAGQGHREPA